MQHINLGTGSAQHLTPPASGSQNTREQGQASGSPEMPPHTAVDRVSLSIEPSRAGSADAQRLPDAERLERRRLSSRLRTRRMRDMRAQHELDSQQIARLTQDLRAANDEVSRLRRELVESALASYVFARDAQNAAAFHRDINTSLQSRLLRLREANASLTADNTRLQQELADRTRVPTPR